MRHIIIWNTSEIRIYNRLLKRVINFYSFPILLISSRLNYQYTMLTMRLQFISIYLFFSSVLLRINNSILFTSFLRRRRDADDFYLNLYIPRSKHIPIIPQYSRVAPIILGTLSSYGNNNNASSLDFEKKKEEFFLFVFWYLSLDIDHTIPSACFFIYFFLSSTDIRDRVWIQNNFFDD